MAKECKPEKERLFCPYCDEEIADLAYPYCEACKVTIFYCPKCRQPVPRDKKVCPYCGAKIRGNAGQPGNV